MPYDPENAVEEIAKDISRFVNSFDDEKMKELGIMMAHDHRTLVQNKMRIVMAFLGELDNLKAHGFCDLRNQAACDMATAMCQAVKDMYLPMV
jgi:hypothetical protein